MGIVFPVLYQLNSFYSPVLILIGCFGVKDMSGVIACRDVCIIDNGIDDAEHTGGNHSVSENYGSISY